MKNETKYNNNKLSKFEIIASIVLYIIIPIILICATIALYDKDNLAPLVALLFVLIVYLLIAYTFLLKSIFGKEKAKKVIDKEDEKIKKENPYIYFRELPNNYGIGVTSLLFDSKIENYKDIIAVILDLCAKKYLSLIKENDKYIIKVLKGIDNQLLSNEKYILNLIISENIRNINYNEWYTCCLQDGNNLGLYFHHDRSKVDLKVETNEFNKTMKKALKIGGIVGAIYFISTIEKGSNLLSIFLSIFISGFIALCIFGFFYFTLSMKESFRVLHKMGKKVEKMSYSEELNNHLTRTEKGVFEMQKLISFKNFLADFGSFADKHPEEIILWDRYLSYAQVFGLAREIMKSGYKQLIDNSSFKIDDIDNITIYNIEMNKSK